MGLLEDIYSPDDVKALRAEQLPQLAEEVRARILGVTSANGGHTGPNLGVVELTIALHRQFSTPTDKILFDVSHQSYVHKLLTGRNGSQFDKIRQTGGPSGFMNRAESPHDAFGAGHAGTALSAALGMAVARDRLGQNHHVVAVVGDGAFANGQTMEALNNIAGQTKRLIIILNDNEWSIDRNVGAMARYFNALLTTPFYNRWNRRLKNWLSRHRVTRPILEVCRSWKRGLKDILFHSSLFEAYGVRYIGPIDGHDLAKLEKYLAFAKTCDQPVFLHVLTQKGRGYQPAVEQPAKFHGTGPFDLETGDKTSSGTSPAYQDAFGNKLAELAQADSRVVGITAAMAPGTGLSKLRGACPGQFFDVGIAEEHAVTFGAGLAAAGMRPVVAIYSTFMQRAFDQAIHDVCLQNLPVVFCMDRAGFSPADGATHHGLFDIAFIRTLPNATLMQPRNCAELAEMLEFAMKQSAPVFIRYPKGGSLSDDIAPAPIELGKAEILREGKDVQIWSLGNFDKPAREIAEKLESQTGLSVGVVNARYVKPLDSTLLLEQAQSAKLIVTLEDAQASGGFGSAVLETLSQARIPTPVEIFGVPDRFIPHASDLSDCRASAGLDSETIYQKIVTRLASAN